MGGRFSRLTEAEYQWFEENTYFARVEIMKLHKIFSNLTKSTMIMPKDQFLSMAELKNNPFKFRIFDVFCENGEHVSFREFAHFLSVFSDEASMEIKSYFAFLIYDANEDDFLDIDDLNYVIESIAGSELTYKEIKVCIDKILSESDVDGDGKLSYVEFEHVIQRSPNFRKYFISNLAHLLFDWFNKLICHIK
jgi:Ca2+-binding EF-hand superfamily protein